MYNLYMYIAWTYCPACSALSRWKLVILKIIHPKWNSWYFHSKIIKQVQDLLFQILIFYEIPHRRKYVQLIGGDRIVSSYFGDLWGLPSNGPRRQVATTRTDVTDKRLTSFSWLNMPIVFHSPFCRIITSQTDGLAPAFAIASASSWKLMRPS